MGDRRISDLTAQTSFASGDCLAVDNSGNTESKKITAANAITTPINNVSQKVSGSTDAYSSSKAYSVGDLVIYNNTVYECTTACSAASWSVNQSNFTATTLSSKLTSLNQALSIKTLATATANQTWGQQLAILYSKYATLTNSEKAKCFIVRGDDDMIFYPQYISLGLFSALWASGNSWAIYTLNLSGSKYEVCNAGSMGNQTSTNDSAALYLKISCNI